MCTLSYLAAAQQGYQTITLKILTEMSMSMRYDSHIGSNSDVIIDTQSGEIYTVLLTSCTAAFLGLVQLALGRARHMHSRSCHCRANSPDLAQQHSLSGLINSGQSKAPAEEVLSLQNHLYLPESHARYILSPSATLPVTHFPMTELGMCRTGPMLADQCVLTWCGAAMVEGERCIAEQIQCLAKKTLCCQKLMTSAASLWLKPISKGKGDGRG